MPDLSIEYHCVCPSVHRFHRHVQGKTGNYEVTYGPTPEGNYQYGWHCTCSAFRYAKVPGSECKHIKAVKGERCAWNEEAYSGSGAARPEDGKCPNCGEPLEVIKVAV